MMKFTMLHKFSKWFWNEDVWLPPNTTWEDIGKTDVVKYAQFNDLYYAVLVAVVLLMVRYTLERFIFTPIGLYFGLKPCRPKRAPENHLLEKAFRANGRIGYKQIQGLAKQLDWPERKVERWIRQRKLQEKPTTLAKFTESFWRLTFYCSVFAFGLYTLSDKPWFWDTKHCWYDYPHHDMTDDIWWYYMIELGFYTSLTFSQFMDIRRKDFAQMFVHHIVTILLLSFSWASNLTRIGTIVLIVHDFADCPLEAAKMAKYIHKQRLGDMLFVVFTLAWIISRLGLYPYRVIYSTAIEAAYFVEMFPAYYIFNGLLCALQVLHIVWTWMIVRVALRAISSKQVKDIRSDDSSCASNSSECNADSNCTNRKQTKS